MSDVYKPTPQEMGMTTETQEQVKKMEITEEKPTILLGVDTRGLQLDELEPYASELGFERKKEFHITIIGFKVGGEIKKLLKKHPEKELVLQQINGILQQYDWVYTPKNDVYKIAKDYEFSDPKNKEQKIPEHRETYVQMVELPDLAPCYTQLNQLLGTAFSTPLPHVTLFVKGSPMGIGVNSEEEFFQLHPEKVEIST